MNKKKQKELAEYKRQLTKRYLDLTNKTLPALAQAAGDWVVWKNHCFQRVILDNAVECCWYDKFKDRRPAYKHMTIEQLERAVEIAEEIVVGGAERLREYNDCSKAWRKIWYEQNPQTKAS